MRSRPEPEEKLALTTPVEVESQKGIIVARSFDKVMERLIYDVRLDSCGRTLRDLPGHKLRVIGEPRTDIIRDAG